MPRKKQLVSRNEKINFRITPLEKKVIELAAQESNLTTSEFARKAALNQKVTIRFSDEEFQVYKDLQVYHRNFKYLSNLIKSSEFRKYDKITTEIQSIITLIKKHLNKFET